MRLATFIAGGQERIGFVQGEQVWGLRETQDAFAKLRIGEPKPTFMSGEPFPATMQELLDRGQPAIDEARRLQDHVITYVDQGRDPHEMRNAVFNLNSVTLKSPIPRPRFLFGLTGNCAKFWRSKGMHIPLYPIGFLRPWTCVRGHMETVTIPSTYKEIRSASELGVIIAPGGRDIPQSKAMEHVAGYTCANDLVSNHWKDTYTANAGGKPVFIDECTSSFYGRSTDGFAPVGPYLTTPDEVGDPYALTIYSRLSGVVRDRSHTNAMLVGIADAIAWLSRLVTLPAGSIIYMGTMGVDGFQIYTDQFLGPDDYVEVEYERIGVLRTPIDDRRVRPAEEARND